MEIDDILKELHHEYPHLKYYLNVSTPIQILVGAILSAQVRDEAVNATLPDLFDNYKNANDFAKSDLNELIANISNITFAGNKAKNIIATCQILVNDYKGDVPKTEKELSSLPGIGKKTAHVILQNAYDIVEGVVVDTHVLRVSYRLGWSSNPKNANKTSKELEKLIPKREWKKTTVVVKGAWPGDL